MSILWYRYIYMHIVTSIFVIDEFITICIYIYIYKCIIIIVLFIGNRRNYMKHTTEALIICYLRWVWRHRRNRSCFWHIHRRVAYHRSKLLVAVCTAVLNSRVCYIYVLTFSMELSRVTRLTFTIIILLLNSGLYSWIMYIGTAVYLMLWYICTY